MTTEYKPLPEGDSQYNDASSSYGQELTGAVDNNIDNANNAKLAISVRYNPYSFTQSSLQSRRYQHEKHISSAMDHVYMSVEADIQRDYNDIWSKRSYIISCPWFQALPVFNDNIPQDGVQLLHDALCLDEDDAYYQTIDAIIAPYISHDQRITLDMLDKDLTEYDSEKRIESFTALALHRAVIIDDIFDCLPDDIIDQLDSLERAYDEQTLYWEPQIPLQQSLPYMNDEQQVTMLALNQQLEQHYASDAHDKINVINHLQQKIWIIWHAIWVKKSMAEKLELEPYFNSHYLSPRQHERKNILAGLTEWFK